MGTHYNPFRKRWVLSRRLNYSPPEFSAQLTARIGAKYRPTRTRQYSESESLADSPEDMDGLWLVADRHDRFTNPNTHHVSPSVYTVDAMAYESVMVESVAMHVGERAAHAAVCNATCNLASFEKFAMEHKRGRAAPQSCAREHAVPKVEVGIGF